MSDDIHEPMVVRRVDTDRGGSQVEPPLDQSWDDLTKLRWQAGVVEADTGIRVCITTNCYWTNDLFGRSRPVKDAYGIQIGGATYVSYRYHEAWIFMTGIGAGYDAVSRRVIAA